MRQKTSDNWPWYNNSELDFDYVPYETLAKQLNLPKNPTNKPKQDVCETPIYIRNEIADHFRYNHLVDSDTLTHTRDLFRIFAHENYLSKEKTERIKTKIDNYLQNYKPLGQYLGVSCWCELTEANNLYHYIEIRLFGRRLLLLTLRPETIYHTYIDEKPTEYNWSDLI